MAQQTIKLTYWNEKKYPNFGDQLSPYIIKHLFDAKIIYKQEYFGIIIALKKIAETLFRFRFKDLCHIQYPYEKNLLAIGSIISYGNPNSTIWGSGFKFTNDKFRGGKILAVRGKFTKQELERRGFDCPSTLGDPALLLPLIFPQNNSKCGIGIIPHWTETEEFKRLNLNVKKIIDLNTSDIENTIKQISSCELILSTSLHGIIVAHAYGVPALWIKKGDIQTDGIKFKDYFSSVDIPIYDGFTNLDDFLYSENSIRQLFKDYSTYSLPQKDIKEIQIELLKAAPYKLVNKYTQIILKK